MGRLFGFVGILIVAAAGFYIYSKQATAVSPAGATASPRATIDMTGVKNDLLAIAQAERGEFALNGKYATLDQLRSSGALNLPQDGRGPFRYSAEVSDSSFRVVATYGGEPIAGVPHTMSIDETMQIRQE